MYIRTALYKLQYALNAILQIFEYSTLVSATSSKMVLHVYFKNCLGNMGWPPYLPDMTPFDLIFFPVRLSKTKVYQHRHQQYLEALKEITT